MPGQTCWMLQFRSFIDAGSLPILLRLVLVDMGRLLCCGFTHDLTVDRRPCSCYCRCVLLVDHHYFCLLLWLLQLGGASLTSLGALMLSVYNSDQYTVQPQAYMVRQMTSGHVRVDYAYSCCIPYDGRCQTYPKSRHRKPYPTPLGCWLRTMRW
jgi:hypothetical protein